MVSSPPVSVAGDRSLVTRRPTKLDLIAAWSVSPKHGGASTNPVPITLHERAAVHRIMPTATPVARTFPSCNHLLPDTPNVVLCDFEPFATALRLATAPRGFTKLPPKVLAGKGPA
eukprot:scaffold93619_cov33-Phaeocystis_antarctica.AAC.1